MTTNAMHPLRHSTSGLAVPALLLMMVAPALAGYQCGDGSNSPASGSVAGEEVSVEGVPADFRIIVGSGGGFTGRWEGYLIASDGQVWAWSGIGVPTDTTHAGTIAPDSLSALWQDIRDASFLRDGPDETGNVTAVLEITADGETHRSTWIPSVEQLEPPKSPTEALYRRVRRLAAGSSH